MVVSERELETFGGPERRGDLGSITESPGKHQDSREEKWFHGMFQQQGLNQPCRDFPHQNGPEKQVSPATPKSGRRLMRKEIRGPERGRRPSLFQPSETNGQKQA